MAYENYRKAKKDEILCHLCRYGNIRWYSKRCECTGAVAGPPMAVGKKHTCDSARAK